MTAEEYEARIAKLDIYPRDGKESFSEAWYYALGIAGESGEVVDKIKKYYRDGFSASFNTELAKELGDVLWYLTRLANRQGYNLDDIMNMNVEKLEDRQRRNQQRGSGDNR